MGRASKDKFGIWNLDLSFYEFQIPIPRADGPVDRHASVDSKTVAEQEAERLRIGVVDDTLGARTRELLGLPASTKPTPPTLTIGHLLTVYAERHVARSATVDRQGYQIGIVVRTVLPRPTGGSVALGDWLLSDVTADTLERLREARILRDVHTRATGSNRVGGVVAANRDLRLPRGCSIGPSGPGMSSGRHSSVERSLPLR
jgi:hypothetical protein